MIARMVDARAFCLFTKQRRVEDPGIAHRNRARKSRTTLQNKDRLKVLPEQLTLFVNTSVTFKKCIIQ